MSKNYQIHVVSNTHWDREWLCDFQETRMMLVEMFDKLLDVLDSRSDYRAFLLDSQVVPVEDYLEVRPENRERIVQHVGDGRLHIGPWYTDPECFSVGGESLVRNLVYGHKVADEFGGPMKVGHTPFSYGQNSQMPQIYAGFGIDTMLFYHGVSHDQVKNEFIFEGADGTQILASQLSSNARYNFYYGVYRYVKYGRGPDDRMRDWRDGGCPFHLCSEQHAPEHHILLDAPGEFDRSILGERVQWLREQEVGVATTKNLAFMMGHDSSLPDELTLDIIEEAREHLGNDHIFHSTLPDLMEAVKEEAKDLEVLKGERRVPKPMPLIMHLYSDVLSSRTRMKRLNQQAEMDLQRWTEPFATFAWHLGAEYPQSLVDMAWKTLLTCHAHDSIAGSGVDDIEQDMMYRLRQVLNISGAVKLRALQHIQKRIDNSSASPDDVLLTAFNASPRDRAEVVTAVLDMPRYLGYREFGLRPLGVENAEPIRVQVAGRKPHHAIMNHSGDAPCMMEAERFTVHFPAEVPATGYATYRIDPDVGFDRTSMVCGRNAMENEHLRVEINEDGTLDVTHKGTDTVYEGLHYFEDSGEAGMTWMHLTPAHDEVITSHGCPVQTRLVEDGPYLARYEVAYQMQVPAGLDENGSNPWQRLDGVGNNAKRSDVTVPLTIVSTFTLRKGAEAVEVTTCFNNAAKNHRLRAMFPTQRKTNVCHVETAFDVVERDVVFAPDSPWNGSPHVTFPMQRFVDVSDGKTGLAIVNDGLREYEVTQDPTRTIGVTLLRAFEVSLTTVSKRWDVHPEMGLSQSPGEHEFRYLIHPHKGRWDDGNVYAQVDQLNVPIEPAQTGAHKGDLPQRDSFMRIDGKNVILSALKRSEAEDTIVVRLFNPSERKTDATLVFAKGITGAALVNMEEVSAEDLGFKGNTVKVSLGRKKIVTLRVTLQ